MNYYALSSLVSAVVLGYLGVTVFYRDKKAPINRLFALFCLLTAISAFGEFAYRQAASLGAAYFWEKSVGWVWILAIPVLIHFTLVYADNLGQRWARPWLATAYVTAVALFFIVMLSPTISRRGPWGFSFSPARPWVMGVVDVWAFAAGLAPIVVLAGVVRAARGLRRQQAAYILAGLACPAIVGVALLIAKNLGLAFPEVSNIALTLLALFVGVAIETFELFSVSPVRVAENIVSVLSDALIITNGLGQILTVNQPAVAMLGYDESQILNKPLTDFVSADPLKRFVLITILKESVAGLEITFQAADGRDVPALVSSSLITDRNGDIAASVLVAKDISRLKEAEKERRRAAEIVRESEAKFRSVVEQVNEGMLITEPGGKIVLYNQAVETITGHSMVEAEELGWLNVLFFGAKGQAKAARLSQALRESREWSGETSVIRRDGKKVWLTLAVSAIKIKRRQLNLIVLHDITDRKTAEEAIKTSEARFRAITEAASDSIVTIDSYGRIIAWNSAAEREFNYSAGEILEQNVTVIIPERFRQAHKAGLARLLAGGRGSWLGRTVELNALRRDGSEFPIELSLSVWESQNKVFFTGIMRDITERKRAQDAIAHLAYHDIVTDLPNRRLFVSTMEKALSGAERHQERAAVLFLDLDGFKEINDRHGHAIGDALLQAVAERLTKALRRADTAARTGGDEFNIILSTIKNREAAGRVVLKFLKVIAAPYKVRGQEIRMTASVGVSIYPDDGSDGETLLSKADKALLSAKRHGKNSYRFYVEKRAA